MGTCTLTLKTTMGLDGMNLQSWPLIKPKQNPSTQTMSANIPQKIARHQTPTKSISTLNPWEAKPNLESSKIEL